MRARSLLSRLPAWSNTRRIASIVGSRSSRAVNSSSASAGMRVGAEPAGDVHAEAALDLAVRQRARHGDHAGVVEHRLAAIGRAAGEVDLELARQALRERVAHEVLERRLRPLRDVEHLLRAGAGEVATLDVAHRVAARLAARQPDRREMLHHVGDVVQLDEVELDVLTGRDVAPAAAVAVGDVAHHLELLGRIDPYGTLTRTIWLVPPWRWP